MRIALHGYGKMGHTVERLAKEFGHEIVAILDGHRDEPLAGAEVIIDFSHASAIDSLVAAAADGHCDLVLGTTGWNERVDDVSARVASAGIGGVWSSNFSPGANIFFALARHAAQLAARFGYAAGIEERHHVQKKDAPSGTALRTAAEVRGGSDGKLDPSIVASRVGSEFGLHRLFLDSPDDVLELSHHAKSREGFARGAIVAAEMVRGRKGLFRFEDLAFGPDQ